MRDGLPQFPKPPQVPGGKKGALLAAVLGVSISAGLATLGDVGQNENGGKSRLCAYQDSVGIWTLDKGLIRFPDGRAVKKGDCITQDQADTYFEAEVVNHARPLIRGIPQLYGHENQSRALVDVTYNCGVASVVNGAIGQNIRAGNWTGAQAHVADCKRGTYPRIPPASVAHDCVAKRGGGYLCTIRGLELRRQRNQVRFSIDRPADGEG